MKTLIKKINRILKDRGTRRLLTRIVSVSAALVVFVTTYALVLPAITMETEAQCGIEAHQHSDSCYEDVLVCGLEESDGHTHDDSCYSISQELTCEIPEHQHDKTCYDEDGNLQCQLSEHDHTDNCYKEVRELTCTLEESEGHHHTDACYEKNLICGKEVHTHSPACYEKTETAAVAASEGYTAGVAYEINDDDAADDFGSSDTDGLEMTDDPGYTDGVEAAGESDDADTLEETDGPDGADALEETDGPGDTDATEWTDHNDVSEDAVTFEETGDPGNTDASGQTYDPGEPDGLEVTSHDAIWEDADSAGTSEAADYSDSSEEAGSTDPSQETDNAGLSDWDPPLQEESEAAPTTNILPEDLENEELSDGYVPQLDSLNFDSVLNDHTAFYYFHPEEGEEVPANSVDIASWKPVDENTELAPTDLVKAYLAYTIPAGSLNETNQVARYRLPSNLHLTEEQILAINSHENGIAAGYIDPETNTVPDEDAANYSEYLGAEAVEGTRRPDQAPGDGSVDGEQEYISATVKAENVFDEEGLYGEKGAYLGQDLIFVFSPYTIQKNQTTYDKDGNPTARGEKVTGWFAVDFNMDQIDWSEPVETILPADNENQTAAAAGLQRIERTANIVFAAEGEDENNHKIHEISTELKLVQENAIEITTEDQPVADAEEQTETPESDEAKKPSDEKSETDQTDNSDSAERADSAENDANADADSALAENKEGETEKAAPEYKDGTLEANGSGYKITMDYKADARIPENAYLHVTEITRESDAEAYEACLEEARKSVPADGTRVDDKASRFFDIEILIDEHASEENNNKDIQKNDLNNTVEDQDNTETEVPESEAADSEKLESEEALPEKETTTRKIEPAAPVSVNIQLFDTEFSQKADEFNAEQYKVVHIAEDGTEEIQDVKAQTIESEKKESEPGSAIKGSDPDVTAVVPATEVRFEAESFSIYGVVYTVDFHWEVDGKTYEFSIPGGGFVSFEHLIEVLNIASTASDDKNAKVDNSETYINSGAESVGAIADETIRLNDVEVSEETKKFVEEVENIQFSNPLLADISKVFEDSTVGKIKAERDLEVEYSADLTEEQIDEINAQIVKAGDWALISIHPFLSEESLTVTMKDGEVFTIKVTDAQDPYGLDGQSFEIVWNGNTALNPVLDDVVSGHTYLNDASVGSGSSLAWKFEYDENAFGEGHGGYYISHEGNYIKMVGTGPNDAVANITLEASKENASPIAVHYDKNTGKYSFSNTADASIGFLCHMYGNNWNGYFGISETATSDSWMELKNPDNPSLPGLVSPWDIRSDNIVVKLFDYSGKVSGNNDIDSKWGTDYDASTWRSGSGINNNRTFLFTGGGRNDSDDPYNYYTGDNPKVMQGIVKNHLVDGYPELTQVYQNGADASLGYLFGAGGQSGVTEYSGSDGNGLKGLLRKNEAGYYYYSSEENFATLVTGVDGQGRPIIGNDEILIYSESYNKDKGSVNAKKIGLFPFDPYRQGQSKAGEEKGPNGSPYNHQFGMSMEATFVLPPDGKLPNGDDMQFNFSGDDDVWVFIDDVLVLDLGGVHQPLSGKINFAGEGYSAVTDAGIQTVSGQTTVGSGKTLAELFEAAGEEYDDTPYSTHTIKFFYLERGGCDSNCTLSFNLLMYKTLTVAKELEGLTDEERAKYANNEFTCDIFVNGKLYNGSDTIRYDAAGNVIEEGFEISNGKVNLKPGERVRIVGLQPKDTIYAAEENGLNMTEFYPPRAERFYQDQNKASHEEEVDLTEEHSGTEISDWRTQTYPVENLEELMITNTLREKNLDVEKTWSDGAGKHSGEEVKFKVAAKVKIDDQVYDYSDVISAMYSDTTIQNQKIADVLNTTYTLSAANGWKAQLEHLPAVNNAQQEIFYEVIEVQTADGYASTVSNTDSHNIDVVKIFPEDHTFEDEEIQFKLKKGSEYYNEASNSWGSSSSATVYTLNASNNYTQRFHDFPAGDYSYEKVDNGGDNQLTDGLVIYDRALKKFDILNGPFKITVEKKWNPADLANEQVDGRKVEITLGRYILMDKKGNLTIRKDGVPTGANFKAKYTVKNTVTNEIFGIYPYVPGGITIDVPEGTYSVTEEIIQDDDTYNHVHGEDTTQNVQMEDGGTATAVFTSTYTPIMGQMTIKSTLEANGTGVSFANVKYEVYDTSGTKVKEIPFSQATGDGATFEIKTGNYVVKEVNVPETPSLAAKFKPKKTGNDDREVGVTVKQGGDPATAEFKATYQPNKATVKVTISNGNPNEKTWTDFNVGDTIRITYKRNNSETINVPTVTGGTLLQTSPVQDVAPGNGNRWNGTYHVDIKITDKNVTAAFTNPGTHPGQYDNYTAMNTNDITITRVSTAGTNSAPNAMSKMLLRMPFRAANETYKDIDLPAAGTAGTVPDAPEGSKYVEDTSFAYETITLNYGNWSKVLSDLPSVDAKGNHYYYYIKSVHEENMPSLVEGSIKLDGDGNHLFVGSDNASTPLTVTNAIPKGSLDITKTIQKNGLVDTSATGTFYFAIYNEEYDANASPAQTPIETGRIQVTENGTNTVTVPDLYYGTYYVYELTGEGGTPIVSGSEGVRKVIADTVYQITGSGTTAVVGESTPSVTLTNNKETVNVEVEKDWQDNNNAKGNRPSQLKVTLSNETEVTLNSGNNWKAAVNDLPKYNSEGQLIVYTWTEETIGNGYTLIGTNIDSVTGADGTETQTTTLTNGPDEHYNPKTTFTGTKTWNDDGTIRPDEIVVILYKGEGAQKEEVERKTLEKKEDGSNVWAYEFTNIPVFDEQGNVIQYSVEEVLPNGYTCSLNTGTSSAPGYERDTANDQVYVNEPNADVRVSTGVNLGFVVIKHGNDFIIWTPRKATEAELTEIKNKVAAENNAVGDQEFSQILVRPLTNVYGVPSDGIQKGNMKASIYMDGDEVVVHFGNKNWSQLAWGQLAYTYTPGRTDLINTQKTTGLEFYKKWINSVGMESEWDKDIEVTVRRNGDSSFSLVYNLAKADIVDGKMISPTTNNDADPKIKVSVTENEGKKTYLFTIEGLDYGNENNEKYTYTVTETNDQLEGYIAPTYSNTSAPTGATAAYDKGTIINQQPGVELPSTGGPGTRLFTILGSILILGAGVLLWRRRRLI